jgi:hypothetical protein
MDRRVQSAVEKELTAKGYKREATADPDFLVTYYPVYQNKKYRTSTTVGMGWGFRPRWGLGIGTAMHSTQEHTYKEGTIVIEISDFKTNQLIWHGAAEGALTGLDNPEDADEVVAKAVRRLLERFPPEKR